MDLSTTGLDLGCSQEVSATFYLLKREVMR